MEGRVDLDKVGKRVLVVEDQSFVSMLIERYLEDLGHEVVGTASRLEEALVLANTLALDLAVLDVNLNGKLSYPVAVALRARGVPFLFATGYGTAGLPEELRGAPVLAKPFAAKQLAKAICHAAS